MNKTIAPKVGFIEIGGQGQHQHEHHAEERGLDQGLPAGIPSEPRRNCGTSGSD